MAVAGGKRNKASKKKQVVTTEATTTTTTTTSSTTTTTTPTTTTSTTSTVVEVADNLEARVDIAVPLEASLDTGLEGGDLAHAPGKKNHFEEDKGLNACQGLQLKNKGDLKFNCKFANIDGKPEIKKICKVKCGKSRKGRNAKTPVKVYCKNGKWGNRKGKPYNIHEFGCKE